MATECDEVLYSIFSMKHQLTFSSLHYAIENTAHQNAGNPCIFDFITSKLPVRRARYAVLIVFDHCIFYGMK